MGDFNSIRRKEDIMNCVYNMRDTENFNKFMEDTRLIEIEGISSEFTWFGPKEKKSRLDRVVVNELWLSSQVWKLSASHRRNSDHTPLYLSGNCANWGPKPFRAFDDWMKVEGVKEVIEKVIKESLNRPFNGTLKEIKLGIKSWYSNDGGKIDSDIASLENKLQILDKEGGVAEEKLEIFQQLQHAYNREVIQLKQKSRAKWNIEGDYNTRFFHRIIQH